MNNEPAVETRALTMRYGPEGDVLRGVDLRVPRGAVYGLLGRNGAGKTTLIRILMGLYRQTGGVVRVLGGAGHALPLEVRQRIGYLSQDQRMFGWMTLEDLMAFTRTFYPTWDVEHAERLVADLGVPRRVPLTRLSRGEHQKAGLLLALAPRPDLLILDEPAANLDTVVRRSLLESILDGLTDQGMTVLISSHILTDVERVADHIGILVNGRIELDGSLDAIKASCKRLRVVFPETAPEHVNVPGAIRMRRRGREILVTVRDFSRDLPDDVRRRFGASVEVQDIGLEDLFIEYVTQETTSC